MESASRIQISDESLDTHWDEFVASLPHGHHVQTSLWGQVKATTGWRALRIKVLDHDSIAGGLQVLFRSLPMVGGYGYVTKGPLFKSSDPVLMETVLAELTKLIQKNHWRYFAVQPPVDDRPLENKLLALGFTPTHVELAPTASILIDLAPDYKDILAQMKRQTRQNINRSEREGMAVREGGREDIHTLYQLNSSTSQRQDFIPFPESYFLQMWDIFEPYGYIKLLLSEYNHESVSALLLIPFGNTVIAKVLGWSGLHQERRPNEAVFWGAIRWSKEHGYRYFDFEGIDPDGARAVLSGQPLPEPLKRKPDFFKYGFGGKVTLYPGAYEMIPDPVIRWAYHQILPPNGNKSLYLKVYDLIRKR